VTGNGGAGTGGTPGSGGAGACRPALSRLPHRRVAGGVRRARDWTDEDNQREIAQYGVIPHSVIKYQMGINAGVVYHATPNLHFDVEYFRAQAKWFLGESQVVHVASSGLTFNW
jgi:hypothetical protein